ncbi:MAG: V-type ATP synthase subunit I [Clostridiales bacterium]|nr:V-type ATP synthase subunit I [Clostridiales bacterium]
MALSSMQKLLLIGNVSERNTLIKKLHKLGCVEVASLPEIENMSTTDIYQDIDECKVKIAKLEFCLQTLKDTKVTAKKLAKDKKIEYAPAKGAGMFATKGVMTFETFEQLCEIETDVFTHINTIKEYKDELVALKASNQKETSLIASLAPYMQMPATFAKYKDTQSVSVLLGEVKNTNLTSLERIKELGGEYEVFNAEATSGLAIIIGKENREALQEVLSEVEFAPCSIESDKTAEEIARESKDRVEENDKRYNEIIEKIMAFESIIDDVKRLYDYLSLEVAKLESRNSTKVTESTYYLEAWLPESEAQRVNEELEKCPLSLAFTIRNPLESEQPPTLAVNNAIVAPYESVTNMYSVPFYKEIDPNPGVAFFFFLMFGMMLSDAGYGLLLTLGAGIVLAIRKPPKGELNLVKVIFMGGISTLIWGFLFGSYFGFSAKDLGIWYWFNPIEDPMPLLVVCLAVGLIQMFVGMAINMVALIKKGEWMWGISSAFSWYFLALGIGGIYLASKAGAWLKYMGIVLLAIGVVLLMLSGTFGKKGAKKVSGAFSSLYGIINFFSDLMSYTRIFGLGLATGVIAMVFNQIAEIMYGMLPKVLGVIVMIVIYLVGHIFNVAINSLGAYVHNSRLQFVEYFGKFYTGGGELFAPLGSQMKYYRIGNPIENAKK